MGISRGGEQCGLAGRPNLVVAAVDCLDKLEEPGDEGGKWRWVLESMVRWLYLDS